MHQIIHGWMAAIFARANNFTQFMNLNDQGVI